MKCEKSNSILSQLDEYQLAAVLAPHGVSLINAGAGTGKTTVLTERIVHLIDNGLAAKDIVAVTFTKKAANEIKERVIRVVGDAGLTLRIGTFHYVAARLLRKYNNFLGAYKDFSIIDSDSSYDYMVKAINNTESLKQDSDSEVVYSVDEIRELAHTYLKHILFWKNNMLTAHDVELILNSANQKEVTCFLKNCLAAYKAYDKEMIEDHFFDFSDIILQCVLLLQKHTDILDNESSAIRHMLVDEAQDANKAQLELVRLLTSKHGGLTVVGDEDQNIYSFQGGYHGAMSEMAGENATVFTLKNNRRCTHEILDVANLIVSYNRRKNRKELVAQKSGEPVVSTGHPTDISEANWIAVEIKKLLDDGVSPDEIAILFRTSHGTPHYEEALLKKQVPNVVLRGKSILEREEIKDILSFIRLAVNPFDEISFSRIITKPTRGLGAIALEHIIGIANNESCSFDVALTKAANIKEGDFVLRKASKEGALELSHALYSLHEAVQWLHPISTIIDIAIEKTGYKKWIDEQKSDAKKEEIEEGIDLLKRLASQYENVGANAFVDDIILMTDVDINENLHRGKVKLCTMHSVKGLEFEYVFCPSFYSGYMPHNMSIEDVSETILNNALPMPGGGGVEEERRLAHVAFTRAKKRLSVSFSWLINQKRKKGIHKGPSSFMEECDLKWKELESASSAELGRTKNKRKTHGYDRS